jgi:hypothetical protein
MENTRMYPLKCHKHLGITLNADCKWSNHINTIIEKTSKLVAVLRKLKFKVSRNFLEIMYLTFIRPLLEYAGEVWDNCTLADSERLEKIQLEAARIVTGLTSYASLLSIYKETGWKKLSVRPEKRKLSLFYDIFSGQSPDYLQDLLPITVGQTNNYNLRNSKNFTIPPRRLSLYQSSFFPSTIRLWNNLPTDLRNSPCQQMFKTKYENFMTCLTNHHYIFLLILELLIYYMLVYVKNVVASKVIYLDVI